MPDDFSQRYGDLVQGTYDCVDRIVLNAYYSLAHSAGGFREWWRRLNNGAEDNLDNAHLMRMAGRFSRRVHGFARAHAIPIIDCGRGERKHRIAEEYLATHAVKRGLFLILVGRAMAPVWEVQRSASGVIQNLEKKRPYINHYSFHILDPEWGHITIKMAGHPPFGAQVILNGHEYVACQARKRHLTFTKEGNCFTHLTDTARLARIADTLTQEETIGRLIQVCERWIYSTCLCFALDTEDQDRTGFRYAYSVYQVEYSRNLLFHMGGQMEQVFERMVDRTRARLDVPRLRTMFGAKQRPRLTRRRTTEPRLAVVLETPEYGLSVFKVHFGNLTLKAYTKGERVLRFEAVVHNTRDLSCGRLVERFPEIVARLEAMLERFLTTLDCVHVAFISDKLLDQLPLPSQVGKTRVGGVDINMARIRNALTAVLSLGPAPTGFTVAQLAAKVRAMTGQPASDYSIRQAAYDLKKLRGKGLITKVGGSRRYQVQPQAMRAIAALLILREHVIAPILAGVRSPHLGRKPNAWTPADRHYEQLRIRMQPLFQDLGIAA
jgi:DNA-binding transcriptional ArsR family regulator